MSDLAGEPDYKSLMKDLYEDLAKARDRKKELEAKIDRLFGEERKKIQSEIDYASQIINMSWESFR